MRNDSFANLITIAWARELDLSGLIDAGSRLDAEGMRPLAIVLYQAWLFRNASPMAHIVQFNLGAMLSLEKDTSSSELAYREAIRIAPGFVQPRVNLGTLLEGQGAHDSQRQLC